MTELEILADLLFPSITKTPEYYENLYPPRNLKEGARVSRFAPSPTGFLHFGGLFAAKIAKLNCETTNGVFFLRIEDTDKKREVEDGVSAIINGLKAFGITPDEGVIGFDKEVGDYGPYKQSQRKEIYQAFAKQLVKDGYAYPCFCTAQELEELRNQQEAENVNKGYYGKWAKCRELSFDSIKANIEKGLPWTLRLKSPGDESKKCYFDDVIKGKIEMPENIMDIVLLKTDGIPTYHFAHAVDDHLMRTTHVIRGDEWIASVPVHLQLFKVLGFKPVKYAHIAPIMKNDEGGKRKLSKRKDPEAAVTYYAEEGYPVDAVNEYMLTIANSNFEDWRRANKTAPLSSFPFNLKKMSVSGALFDIVKLNDVSKNAISLMDSNKVFELSYDWAKQNSESLKNLYEEDTEKAKKILSIDRDVPKPRKDIAKWNEVENYISYFYDDSFKKNYQLDARLTSSLAVDVLEKYKTVFDVNDDKDMCEPLGCTPNVKEYKKEPEKFRGHVGDVSTIIRVALTGRTNTPDLHSIIALLGTKTVSQRLDDAINYYKGEI